MQIILRPDEISKPHPDLEHYSKKGELERTTDAVITELQELVSKAVDQDLSSELEGDIVFCLRELEVHAQNIFHDSRDRSIFSNIKAATNDQRLKELGIVKQVAIPPALWRALRPRRGRPSGELFEDEVGNFEAFIPDDLDD